MPAQVLIPPEIKAQLLENGRKTAAGDEIDPAPVVKLFTPEGSATWLLTELDPRDEDTLFGLCDLGMGCPELGYVSLAELRSVRTPRFRLPIERDEHIKFEKPLSAYTRAALVKQRIVTDI